VVTAAIRSSTVAGVAEGGDDLLVLDGSFGEGGGQLLRSALTLALVTGRPFRLERIRARRRNPGLARQHLAAVRAAAAVGGAELAGDELGSATLVFRPHGLRGGAFRFDIGSAGSTTLVAQTVLPALLAAPERSELVLEGGTHNPLAPPFEHLAEVYLPLVARMGARVDAQLDRPGFFPAGGGRLRLAIEPARLAPLLLEERGPRERVSAEAQVAGLPASIAERELAAVAAVLGETLGERRVRQWPPEFGPGNVLLVRVTHAAVAELFTGFGERGVPAETVGRRAARAAARYLASTAATSECLADQLLLPLALAGGGRFSTVATSSHFVTNAWLVRQFLSVEIHARERGPDRVDVELVAAASAASG
jgi:RNA 3'-terminal phosphate cyclase (ATP)